MRAIKPASRGRPAWQWGLFFVLFLVVSGAGTVAGLVMLRVVDPARLAFWRPAPGFPADWVAIPISARPIPAYSKITREDLIDPKTGRVATVYWPPTSVPKSAILDLSVIGRVLGHEKSAGYAFTEDELLPPGTHPGLAGGTPPNKRAYTLDASRLKGIHDLAAGDHLDLLASIPVDMPGLGQPAGGHSGANVFAAPDTTLLPKRSVVRPLVQDGVVVVPVRTRNVPISSSSLMNGTSTRTMPVQEVTIAVDPEEVAHVAEALDQKYEITCVARSGRGAPPTARNETADEKAPARSPGGKLSLGPPQAVTAPTAKSTQALTPNKVTPDKDVSAATAKVPAEKDLTPGFDPFQQVRGIETIHGDHRQFVYFIGPGGAPVISDADGGSRKESSPQGPTAENKP